MKQIIKNWFIIGGLSAICILIAWGLFYFHIALPVGAAPAGTYTP